jgi:hypothetical protein
MVWLLMSRQHWASSAPGLSPTPPFCLPIPLRRTRPHPLLTGARGSSARPPSPTSASPSPSQPPNHSTTQPPTHPGARGSSARRPSLTSTSPSLTSRPRTSTTCSRWVVLKEGCIHVQYICVCTTYRPLNLTSRPGTSTTCSRWGASERSVRLSACTVGVCNGGQKNTGCHTSSRTFKNDEQIHAV